MKLSPAMKSFILHWGDMGAKWGVNRSVAQIHALLHLSDKPLPADTIAECLGIARSNVSNGIKELQGWKLVKSERQLGDRRDHFTSVRDMFDLAKVIADGRREREFTPSIDAVRQTYEAAAFDGETPEAVQTRIRETLETMELFDAWYRDISALPRPVQKAMLKLGAGIARLIPRS